jgi:SAM-dependent methyltransferase
MALKQTDLDYFALGKHENPKFFGRLGSPNFANCTVLDVGCGHGSICIDVAKAGAKRVIGFDLDQDRIDFARENLRLNFPGLADRAEFRCEFLEKWHGEPADYIIAKDTFEHVVGLPKLMRDIRERLKVGGRLLAGFGPLWNSMLGDHQRCKMPIPFGHVMVPEPLLVRWINLFRPNDKIQSIHDLGLSKLSLAEYKQIFADSGLAPIFFQVNCSENAISHLWTKIARFKPLEEYFSHNIYCVLERCSENCDERSKHA